MTFCPWQTQGFVLPIAIAMHLLITAPLAVLVPGIYGVLSLAIPPRARGLGFAIGSLYVIPGLIVLPLVGGLADDIGVRPAIFFLVPIFLVGAAIIASAGSFVAADIHKVRTSTVAQAEVRAARARVGRAQRELRAISRFAMVRAWRDGFR